MNWDLQVSSKVKRKIKKFPHKDAMRVFKALFALNPNPYEGDVKKLQGEENVWRKRVGNYRIVYQVWIKEKTIVINDVRKRDSQTY